MYDYFYGAQSDQFSFYRVPTLIHAGVDPKTVQYLAGHKNSKVTMDIYAKVKYNKPEQLSGVVNAALCRPHTERSKQLSS